MREQNAPTNLASARVCPCGHWRSGSPHGHVTTCSTSPLPARSSSAMAPCASPSWIASGSVFRIEFSGNTRAILSSLITPHMLEPSAIGPCAQRLCRAQDHGNRGAMYAHSVWHLVSAGNMHIHRHARIEYMHSRRAKIATQGPQRVAALSAVRQPSRGSPVCCCTIKDTVLDVRHTAPRLHVQARQIGMGAVAARAHRLCLCAYRKQRWAAFASLFFPIFAGRIFSNRFCGEGTRSEEHPRQFWLADSVLII